MIIDINISEEQLMIQRMARDFAKGELRPVAAKNDREASFPLEQVKKMGSLGMMGLEVSPEFGGVGAGAVAYSLAITEIARECASAAVTMSVSNMVAEAISRFGTIEQKKKHCYAIAKGAYVAASFCLTEPGAGSDVSAIRTRAARKGDVWILNGSKAFISNGSYAGVFLIIARTGEGGKGKNLTAFLVEPGTPGLVIGRKEEKMGMRASNTVALTLEDCVVGSDAMLGAEGEGYRIAMTALCGGRIGVASQALGIGLAAQEEAVRYARERKSFGKPIWEHQAIQFMLVDSEVELEASSLLILKAASLKEKGVGYAKESSAAKLYATEAANRVCYRAVQVFGGYGYSAEYPVERHYRDARVTTIYEGTSEIQRLVIGREVIRGDR